MLDFWYFLDAYMAVSLQLLCWNIPSNFLLLFLYLSNFLGTSKFITFDFPVISSQFLCIFPVISKYFKRTFHELSGNFWFFSNYFLYYSSIFAVTFWYFSRTFWFFSCTLLTFSLYLQSNFLIIFSILSQYFSSTFLVLFIFFPGTTLLLPSSVQVFSKYFEFIKKTNETQTQPF